MDVGARITSLRTAKHYTVNKLATLAGISQSYLRDVELGNKNPTVEVLSYVCDALGISLSEFFDDETEKKLISDPLINAIYQLNKEQRESLLTFLNTIK
ncbi:MAG TPA: helix-turn-helix domain-containing protein [Candidatus Lachnoclostridium pullistercoris]|uniref:Helix-turn-helix domain-containing protein n=1 Tax=Candidatus Lachnoclostridium pullistercoris TaxID=2838632 RepID=A0A9D2PEQ2_9FIRM|nr:helix-turn-helix domain-containing protein [Candidatus Lachnoclostridium pullistercoris]